VATADVVNDGDELSASVSTDETTEGPLQVCGRCDGVKPFSKVFTACSECLPALHADLLACEACQSSLATGTGLMCDAHLQLRAIMYKRMTTTPVCEHCNGKAAHDGTRYCKECTSKLEKDLGLGDEVDDKEADCAGGRSGGRVGSVHIVFGA
jgi:hypothetical protein